MQALLSRLPCCSHSFSRSLPLAAAAAAGSARHSYRQHARVATFATALTFDKHGDPPAVLQLRQSNLPQELGDTDVHLQILAAPINPSDINTVQGKYPLCPALPAAVPGHEGVAKVLRTGSKVSGLQAGDHVVPLASALGTWRSEGLFAAGDWHKVPQDLPLAAAATLAINPPTALLMLESIVQLQPGDVVIQNGATSGVGQHVVQLARAKGIKTVNVIRDRPDWDATVGWLQDMGGDVVTTEQQLKTDLAAAGLPPPALALNCIGGSSAAAIAKVLRPGGTHVTYGAMSMQPLTPPTGLLIFKDITFRGFWVSGGWAKKAGPAARGQLFDRLADYYKQGVLRPPKLREFALEEWQEALTFAQAGHRREKAAFVPSANNG